MNLSRPIVVFLLATSCASSGPIDSPGTGQVSPVTTSIASAPTAIAVPGTGEARREQDACHSVTGVEWKNYVSRLVHDAATDFGRWEFTTDLRAQDGRLSVSPEGLARCQQNGRTGCPAIIAGLSAQDGEAPVLNERGIAILDPVRIRSELLAGFSAQLGNERNGTELRDASAAAANTLVQSRALGAAQHSVRVIASTPKACGEKFTYQVEMSGGTWSDVRAKLVTVGYLRGNDLLDVSIDPLAETISVDPFNVDFLPPSAVSPTNTIDCNAFVKSQVAETWRSSEDVNAICPIGAECNKMAWGSSVWSQGVVKSVGSYRYCYL